MTWHRPVSGIERAWLAAAEVHPPFVLHTVLEGSGAPELGAWRHAMQVAIDANPGAAALLRGLACRMRWQAADAWAVTEVVDPHGWDGTGPAGAPWTLQPMDLHVGPVLELCLVRGPRPQELGHIVVRSPHALMDGAGILALLGDLFRARAGQPVVGHPDRVTDLDLCASGASAGPPPADALPPLGVPAEVEGGHRWARVMVPDPAPRVLARVVHTVARHARRDSAGTVRIDLPVGLRRAHPDVRSTANLTGMMAIEVGEGEGVGALAERIRSAARSGAHEPRVRGAGALRHLPRAVVRWAARRADRDHLARSRFSSTATVSNVGRIDFDVLQAPDFSTRRLFIVPPSTEVTPMFVALVGGPAHVDIVVSVPRRFGTDARFEALVDDIESVARGAPLSR